MYKRYSLTLIQGYFLQEIAAGLVEIHGDDVTIHANTENYLIFSCPNISSKVIKISYISGVPKAYYGDEYGGGTVVTNEVGILNGYYQPGPAAPVDLILGPTFLLLVGTVVSTSIVFTTNPDFVILYGKLTNGQSVALTTTTSSSLQEIQYRHGFLLETGLPCCMLPIKTQVNATHPEDYLIKIPIMFLDSNSHLLVNSDKTPATIAGVFFSPLAADIRNALNLFVVRRVHYFNNWNNWSDTPADSALMVELTLEVSP